MGSGSGIPLVCVIVGQDRLLRGEALAGFMASVGEACDPMGPSRLDGKEADAATVLDDVRTSSLLGHRITIVDDADVLISKHREALEKYCGNPAPGSTLVLLCNSLPKTTRVYKFAAKTGQVITIDPPRGRSVVPWIVDRAQRVHGKPIAAPAAQALRQQLGDSVGRLDSELAKLAAYVGERRQIGVEDVQAVTGQYREERVFAIIDAVCEGRTAEALQQWEQVLQTDAAAVHRSIGGLAWAVRRLLEAKRDYEGGTPASALTKSLFADPGTVKRRLDSVTTDELIEQQRDLLAADIGQKTGRSDLALAMEKFIVKHSNRRQAGVGA